MNINGEGMKVKLLSIERKVLNIKIKTYFFLKEDMEKKTKASLVGYSHSFSPQGFTNFYETLQIDLLKEERELLMDMNQSTRRQVRRAEERELKIIVIDNPTDQDLVQFQDFYNRFAKDKKTYSCTSYHMQTMKLLRDKSALLITYIRDSEGILCYRVYILDEKLAMNLYSASHFRLTDNPEFKKIQSQANRLLTWKSILLFKKKGYDVYDFGGLTEDENIRRFKFGFGGKIVPVYFGYKAKTYTGAIILKIRDLKSIFHTFQKIK